MGLLNKKVIVPEKLNGLYAVTVLSYRDVENEQGGYTEVVFKVTDTKTYKYCIFPSESDGLVDEEGNLRIARWTDKKGKEHKGSQLNYVISSLSSQLGKANELDLASLLELAKTTPIGLAFSYNQDLQKSNVSFKTLQKSEEAVDL